MPAKGSRRRAIVCTLRSPLLATLRFHWVEAELVQGANSCRAKLLDEQSFTPSAADERPLALEMADHCRNVTFPRSPSSLRSGHHVPWRHRTGVA